MSKEVALTVEINTVDLARAFARGAADIKRGRSNIVDGKFYATINGATRAVSDEELGVSCCPWAKQGKLCRHKAAKLLLDGVELVFASDEHKELVKAEEAVWLAGGYPSGGRNPNPAPVDLRNAAGQLVAKLSGKEFVPFSEIRQANITMPWD